MPRFIFFTKTRWDEPPRLRHQLAHLLADAGHTVLFAERPALPWQGVSAAADPATGAPTSIRLFRHRELMHHKLRVGPVARGMNAWWTGGSIRRAVAPLAVQPTDVIVNFNYEYYFLRAIFPRHPLVTVINDDFITTAPRWAQPSLHLAQRLTCAASDAVLTVSQALQEQLAAYCAPELFLPWADIAYQAPQAGAQRDTLIYWGYIGRRIDWALMERLAAELRGRQPRLEVHFVGPTEGNAESQPLFTQHANVKLLKPCSLEQLPLHRVVGSIIPYVAGVPENDAITMPNKAMQLLARGIPLLISGMPRFASAPFVFRMDEGAKPADAVADAVRSFDSVQGAILSFVAGNGPAARLRQFLDTVERARTASGTRQ